MMKGRIIAIWMMVVLLLTCGCGNKKTPQPTNTNVAAAILLSPANNQLCNAGQLFSDTTMSIVTFSWKTAKNATGYTLSFTNLLNGRTIRKKVNGTGTTDTLLKATPYSWRVITQGSELSDIAASDEWRFYNAGPAIINYAPFPAELTSPSQGQSFYSKTTVSLYWTGTSVQNNISGYDIYFGTTLNPPLFKSNYNATFLDNISISRNTTYYWKIITKDTNGNTSDSDLFQFTNF